MLPLKSRLMLQEWELVVSMQEGKVVENFTEKLNEVRRKWIAYEQEFYAIVDPSNVVNTIWCQESSSSIVTTSHFNILTLRKT